MSNVLDSRAMSEALLLYPHQLWDVPIPFAQRIFLVEDPLLFSQYRFHLQKILLHRASMKYFSSTLEAQGKTVRYVECKELNQSSSIGELLSKEHIRKVWVYEFDDTWLEQRVLSGLERHALSFEIVPSPGFLTPHPLAKTFFESQERNFFTDFYVWQRKRLHLLLENDAPLGGKWSFDHENRKRLPKNASIPKLPEIRQDSFSTEAVAYTKRNFSGSYGNGESLLYPHTHASAAAWLDKFVSERLRSFGDYEDAISTEHRVIFHSVLTPMLNIGLLTPQQIVDRALAEEHIPLNSLEGFIRQVIGWREYMRAMYSLRGTTLRNGNFFGAHREIPPAFYSGETGVAPVDTIIKRVLATGYCHHIERLMILGNFMLLCGIRPHAVHQWFMELFVDAYDWVMVPNVYAMSQYADGGTMTTKPYISGSSYVLKMSDFTRGRWCTIWDGLYWNHIAEHQGFYASNHRMSMMAAMCTKLGSKLVEHRKTAQTFLNTLFDS